MKNPDGNRALRRTASIAGASALVMAIAPLALAPTAAASPPAFGSPDFELPLPLPNIGQKAEGPTFELSKSTDLQDGDVLTIKGSGYRPGDGVYLTQTIDKPVVGFPSNYGEAVKVTPDDNGTFTAEMPINTGFNDVDCRKRQCYVASFTAFPNLTDRSQDHWAPIKFADDAKAPELTEGPTATHPGAGAPPSGTGGSATSGNGSATTPSGATVTVSPYSGLNPDGDEVTVTGKGYKNSGPGIYVALAQNDRFTSTNADAFTEAVFIRPNQIGPDGSFTTTLPVRAKGAGNNCLANQCSVFTFAAHGSQDRSQDAAVGISFTGGVGPSGAMTVTGTSGGSGAGVSGGTYATGGRASTSGSGATGQVGATTSNGTLTVNLSTTQLNATGTTSITVTGSGFSTSGPGIYVGVAEKAKFSHTDASVFNTAQWIKPEQMGPGGSWSTTIEAQAVFPGGNCIDNPCALFTFAAHGSSDRSQDTATDLTVAGSEAQKQAAREQAQAMGADQSGDEAARAERARRAAAGADPDATGVEQTSAVTPMFAVGSGFLGAVLGGLLVAGGVAFGRRTARADHRDDAHDDAVYDDGSADDL